MTGTEAQVSWLFAFLAGVVSFLSPCILPLIPGYLSVVTKLSFEELTGSSASSTLKKVLVPSIFFVLGFSFLFVILGASATFLGSFLQQNKFLLLKISGFIIILFSLIILEIIKIPSLYREKRIEIKSTNLSYLGPFLLGIAFGFGWTPCVGPILASILLYASTAEGALEGALLLFIYSLGLGLPFIITGLALTKALSAFSWIKKNYALYKYVTGGALLVVGILMVTNTLFYLNIYGQKILDSVGIDFWKSF
ncbi:MAG: cytochrome c biogenesis protein CcdA [Candidatus Dadabacteria bacterium]|nr:cytochrome c biogenesis protein CcdA [Candidatus Dadabacteria bacterium]NIX15133.1 cytochrome c biogenesis protein CcdA [Candidatus Dadabacteria bacterium]NIY21770.1 cytochrome c biogenesis protein CcdA [Candidatus Dadabacteria bacterium]